MVARSTLFVWDFDNTVVLDNTDTLVFDHHAPDVLATHRAAIHSDPDPLPWVAMIDDGLATLHARGISPEQILASASSVPIPPDTIAALRRIAAAGNARSLVLSDANTLFIAACLDRHGLQEPDVFEGGVFSNTGSFGDDGRIRVSGFMDSKPQHGCHSCASNLCKGEVVDCFLNVDYARWRVVYVGDGGNDYCPVLRLGEDDVVLAREGFPLHKLIKREGKVAAQVKVWSNPKELRSLVENVLSAPSF